MKAGSGLSISKVTWLWYAIALVVIGLDQWSKAAVSASLQYGEPVVFTSFFNFTLLHNYGAAFSFLSDAGGWQRWFFGIIAAVVSSVLVVWIARIEAHKRWEPLALALILGGAIGNLYDRVVLGYVVDFIVFHYEEHAWPAFNIADMAISGGAMMLIIDLFWIKSSEKDAQQSH
ncbi:signal peptidase II [Marinibactrum halimedae]|nr:signal peptidase II [Marinibactrum halimedae]MCD9457614.1 signal peptidase II [Marinibactrum halimedae]